MNRKELAAARKLQKVLPIDMPVMNPNARKYRHGPIERIEVHVLVRTMGKGGKGQLWFALEDLKWLISYLCDEALTSGVPLHTAESDLSDEEQAPVHADAAHDVNEFNTCGSLRKNCSVPDAIIITDVSSRGHFKGYTLKFSDGPLEGQVFSSTLQDFSQAKWQRFAFVVQHAGKKFPSQSPGMWYQASVPQKMNGLKHYLECFAAESLLNQMGMRRSGNREDPIRAVLAGLHEQRSAHAAGPSRASSSASLAASP